MGLPKKVRFQERFEKNYKSKQLSQYFYNKKSKKETKLDSISILVIFSKDLAYGILILYLHHKNKIVSCPKGAVLGTAYILEHLIGIVYSLILVSICVCFLGKINIPGLHYDNKNLRKLSFPLCPFGEL